jgi:hypothetical protein
VLEVDRYASEAMGGGDGSEVNAQGRHGAGLGGLDQVEADDLCLASQRSEAEALTPSGVLGPGGAVGAQRACAARPRRPGGSLPGEFADLGGARRVGGDDEAAEQPGLDGDAGVRVRPGGALSVRSDVGHGIVGHRASGSASRVVRAEDAGSMDYTQGFRPKRTLVGRNQTGRALPRPQLGGQASCCSENAVLMGMLGGAERRNLSTDPDSNPVILALPVRRSWAEIRLFSAGSGLSPAIPKNRQLPDNDNDDSRPPLLAIAEIITIMQSRRPLELKLSVQTCCI